MTAPRVKSSDGSGVEKKNTALSQNSTKSSEHGRPNMHQPVVTIKKRGWVSRVVPNQFDICVLGPTMADEEAELRAKNPHDVPEPEHIKTIEDFQDTIFRGETVDADPDTDQEELAVVPSDNQWDTTSNGKDFFIKKAGYKFAGNHLLIDLWGATNLDKQDVIE